MENYLSKTERMELKQMERMIDLFDKHMKKTSSKDIENLSLDEIEERFMRVIFPEWNSESYETDDFLDRYLENLMENKVYIYFYITGLKELTSWNDHYFRPFNCDELPLHLRGLYVDHFNELECCVNIIKKQRDGMMNSLKMWYLDN